MPAADWRRWTFIWMPAAGAGCTARETACFPGGGGAGRQRRQQPPHDLYHFRYPRFCRVSAVALCALAYAGTAGFPGQNRGELPCIGAGGEKPICDAGTVAGASVFPRMRWNSICNRQKFPHWRIQMTRYIKTACLLWPLPLRWYRRCFSRTNAYGKLPWTPLRRKQRR